MGEEERRGLQIQAPISLGASNAFVCLQTRFVSSRSSAQHRSSHPLSSRISSLIVDTPLSLRDTSIDTEMRLADEVKAAPEAALGLTAAQERHPGAPAVAMQHLDSPSLAPVIPVRTVADYLALPHHSHLSAFQPEPRDAGPYIQNLFHSVSPDLLKKGINCRELTTERMSDLWAHLVQPIDPACAELPLAAGAGAGADAAAPSADDLLHSEVQRLQRLKPFLSAASVDMLDTSWEVSHSANTAATAACSTVPAAAASSASAPASSASAAAAVSSSGPSLSPLVVPPTSRLGRLFQSPRQVQSVASGSEKATHEKLVQGGFEQTYLQPLVQLAPPNALSVAPEWICENPATLEEHLGQPEDYATLPRDPKAIMLHQLLTPLLTEEQLDQVKDAPESERPYFTLATMMVDLAEQSSRKRKLENAAVGAAASLFKSPRIDVASSPSTAAAAVASSSSSSSGTAAAFPKPTKTVADLALVRKDDEGAASELVVFEVELPMLFRQLLDTMKEATTRLSYTFSTLPPLHKCINTLILHWRVLGERNERKNTVRNLIESLLSALLQVVSNLLTIRPTPSCCPTDPSKLECVRYGFLTTGEQTVPLALVQSGKDGQLHLLIGQMMDEEWNERMEAHGGAAAGLSLRAVLLAHTCAAYFAGRVLNVDDGSLIKAVTASQLRTKAPLVTPNLVEAQLAKSARELRDRPAVCLRSMLSRLPHPVALPAAFQSPSAALPPPRPDGSWELFSRLSLKKSLIGFVYGLDEKSHSQSLQQSQPQPQPALLLPQLPSVRSPCYALKLTSDPELILELEMEAAVYQHFQEREPKFAAKYLPRMHFAGTVRLAAEQKDTEQGAAVTAAADAAADAAPSAEASSSSSPAATSLPSLRPGDLFALVVDYAGADAKTLLDADTDAYDARDAISGVLRALHDLGWVHGDVRLRNFAVSKDAHGTTRVRMLDLATTRYIGQLEQSLFYTERQKLWQ